MRSASAPSVGFADTPRARKGRNNRWKRRAAGLGLLALAGCGREAVLDPHGPVAAQEKTILINSTEIMLVVVVPVIVLALGFAWWYRAGNRRAAYQPDWYYSGQIELVVWSIPTMIILLLGGVIWIGAHRLDPRMPIQGERPALRVQVVSLDWKWLFIYPDRHLATVNELVLPAGTPVALELTSGTVMNSFFIPELAGQIYTMPGMTSHLNLLADKPGDYAGIPAHYSGAQFADMHYPVHVLSSEAFDDWVASGGEGGTMDEAAYDELAKPGTAEPARFHGVPPNFFQHILTITAPGGGMATPGQRAREKG